MADKDRIEVLEALLDAEIKKVAKLLEENQRLESELETTQTKLSAFKNYYYRTNPVNKTCCNRDEAMAVSAMPSTPEAE